MIRMIVLQFVILEDKLVELLYLVDLIYGTFDKGRPDKNPGQINDTYDKKSEADDFIKL